MRITAKQAVTTTAKLKGISKKLDFIHTNLLRGAYTNASDLKRVKASVEAASRIAARAHSEVVSELNTVKALKACYKSAMAEKVDDVIEGSLEVGAKAAILANVIADELDTVEPDVVEEPVDDVILDDEGAEVEASEDISDEPVLANEDDDDLAEDGLVDEDTPVEDDEDLVEDDEDLVDFDGSEEDEVIDDIELASEPLEEEPVEFETTQAKKKRASVKATKRASVVKKAAGRSSIGLSWGFPSLPKK